ncbi:hypothetical protein X781_21300 [Mannheimia sp. USDA-ARS-USMARC-1261]|uniref:Slam-dependent surface lipoprotein n=1 Tax=Mannheimia sp. USDA-ARS-USMARC-1261 TaxID=1432056 RepID=UPI0003E32760|nr:Slam-dependent surface lipoprotein [Mannheimia sp. USDA-ARS-USMARC-1261]AHG74275.1 hypothetical protein X781_21300 [Mannheimia sp. USDA-ARS-USMARC-1261]
MSIKKLTLASLILIGLTACGSSGSGSGSNHKSPEQKITEQKQQLKDKADTAKVEAERLKKQAEKAKEKAESLAKEAEKAKTEAERLAQEKAEKAKAEAERLAKEAEKAKMEAERLAKEKVEKAKTEAERLAQEKAEKAKAEAERLAKEAEKAKMEAERLAKEEAEKAKTEAERLAQEKAEKAKAEAERLAKEAEKAKAEAERLAKEKAEKEKSEEQKIIDAKGGVDNKQIGLSEIPVIKEDGGKKETYGSLYNQKYSVVKAQIVKTGDDLSNVNSIVEVKGLNTEKLPSEGKATYNGKAFDAHGDEGIYAGNLTYEVNFSERTGSGQIINTLDGTIDLDKGNIDKGLISSTAHHRKGEHTQSGRYEVQFFGPNAEEIGGKVDIQDDGRTHSFGISGTKAN